MIPYKLLIHFTIYINASNCKTNYVTFSTFNNKLAKPNQMINCYYNPLCTNQTLNINEKTCYQNIRITIKRFKNHVQVKNLTLTKNLLSKHQNYLNSFKITRSKLKISFRISQMLANKKISLNLNTFCCRLFNTLCQQYFSSVGS